MSKGNSRVGVWACGLMVFLAAVVILALGEGERVTSEEPPGAKLTYGVVDVQKVLREVKEFQEMDAQLRQMRIRQGQLLQLRQRYALLTSSEFNELLNLLTIDPKNLNSEQKERLQAIRSNHDGREEEWQKLRSLSRPNQNQKKRLDELNAIRQQARKELDEMGEEGLKRIQDLEENLTKKAHARICDAAAQVGQKKGLDAAFDRQVLLFCRGNKEDITNEVIEALNQSKQ